MANHYSFRNICLCLSKILEDDVFADEIFKKLIETVKWNPLQDESSKDKHKSVNIRPLVVSNIFYDSN